MYIVSLILSLVMRMIKKLPLLTNYTNVHHVQKITAVFCPIPYFKSVVIAISAVHTILICATAMNAANYIVMLAWRVLNSAKNVR